MSEERKKQLAEVERIARELASTMGLEIVDFVFHSQGRHSLLRIDIDRSGPNGVGLADCEGLSRTLSEKLDEFTFFGGPFELQVSSPGIDRPIRSDDDMRRNTGRWVKVEYQDENGKIRERRGTLLGASPDQITIRDGENKDIQVPRSRVLLLKQDVAMGGGKRKNP
jgi:ribosome maturation factor RimP